MDRLRLIVKIEGEQPKGRRHKQYDRDAHEVVDQEVQEDHADDPDVEIEEGDRYGTIANGLVIGTDGRSI